MNHIDKAYAKSLATEHAGHHLQGGHTVCPYREGTAERAAYMEQWKRMMRLAGGVVMDVDIERLKTDAAYWDGVAPEGAEAAYQHEYGVQFLKRSGVDGDLCYFAPNKNWVPFLGRRDAVDRWRASIPRPTKPAAPDWDGEGYPPVGCECDFLTTKWRIGRVVCYVDGRHGKQGIVQFDDDWQCFSPEDVPDRVRPIRTKEQRQRDELAVEIWSLDGRSKDHAYSVADHILSFYNLEPKYA